MSYGTFPNIGDISIYQTSLFAGTRVICLQVFGPANLKSMQQIYSVFPRCSVIFKFLKLFYNLNFFNCVAFGLVLKYSGKKLLEGSGKWDF